jgi:hypothetical protein
MVCWFDFIAELEVIVIIMVVKFKNSIDSMNFVSSDLNSVKEVNFKLINVVYNSFNPFNILINFKEFNYKLAIVINLEFVIDLIVVVNHGFITINFSRLLMNLHLLYLIWIILWIWFVKLLLRKIWIILILRIFS